MWNIKTKVFFLSHFLTIIVDGGVVSRSLLFHPLYFLGFPFFLRHIPQSVLSISRAVKGSTDMWSNLELIFPIYRTWPDSPIIAVILRKKEKPARETCSNSSPIGQLSEPFLWGIKATIPMLLGWFWGKTNPYSSLNRITLGSSEKGNFYQHSLLKF